MKRRLLHKIGLSTKYTGKSFLVSGQDTNPSGLYIKPDGTKLYVMGAANDTVYQYSLSTAWDISTASYDSKSFNINSQVPVPQDVFFKSDGTKMYAIGNSNRTIYQYTLSTAWDVSTASYDSVSFSVSAQDVNPSGMFFKSDGTKFYVSGNSGDFVHQYSLSTPWDMTTASYDSKSFSVVSQDNQLLDLHFSSGGNKMYIIGNQFDFLYQYTLSTAWDVSTASYDSVSFSISAQENTPQGLFFKSNGSDFYVIGSGNDAVYQYQTKSLWGL